VEEFVREQPAPMYRRALDGTQRTRCPEWWRHAEAISRVEALWRAWEQLRLDARAGGGPHPGLHGEVALRRPPVHGAAGADAARAALVRRRLNRCLDRRESRVCRGVGCGS
jgi:hypothetical protein